MCASFASEFFGVKPVLSNSEVVQMKEQDGGADCDAIPLYGWYGWMKDWSMSHGLLLVPLRRAYDGFSLCM